jgi:TRAP-type mannitol/chloroaromatic compound transport system permease small subunit
MLLRLAKKIDNASERSVIFAPLMLPMIVVTMFEVVARYVFNAPTIWANELTQHIFGVYFVIGGAYTLLHDSHAKIDVLYLRLAPWNRAILDCVTYLVFFFPFIVLLLWQITGQAWLSTVRLQGTGTFWNSPVWPTRWGLVLATLWLLVQGLANYIRIQ